MTLIFANTLVLYHCALMLLPPIFAARSHWNCHTPAPTMRQWELHVSFVPVRLFHILGRPTTLWSIKLNGGFIWDARLNTAHSGLREKDLIATRAPAKYLISTTTCKLFLLCAFRFKTEACCSAINKKWNNPTANIRRHISLGLAPRQPYFSSCKRWTFAEYSVIKDIIFVQQTK
jgi:hypothetical protein